MEPRAESPGNLNALANPFEPRSVRSTSLPHTFAPGSVSPSGDVIRRVSPAPRPCHPISARRATRSSADLRALQVSLQGNGNGALHPAASYDSFVSTSSSLTGGTGGVAAHAVQANPYSHDAAAATMGGAAFFPGQTGFQQPV